MDTAPHFYAKNRQAWRAWLEKNHKTETAVWLVFDKGKDRTMSWEDIVQEALCFGWIDSRPGKVSETQSKIYVTKRKPKSVWSKINKQHISNLTSQGLMKPAGLKSVELAKSNGSWNALDLSDNLIYPSQLEEMFETDKDAKNNFESFPMGSRKNSLQWIYEAKTETTKLARIQQVVDAAKNNVRLR
jgi:uncharacterized protein YdeI (YjbR/CyaY-like superfamily)